MNWARSGASAATGSDPRASGRRLVVFVIGGVSRSEMRVVHQLSKSLSKDIVLVSSSVDNPSQFIDKLSRLSTVEGLMEV
jgi:syntaxin-binding protein 1